MSGSRVIRRLTQFTLSALFFRRFSALAYGLTNNSHYHLTSLTCCLSLARRKTPKLQEKCYSRKQPRDTWAEWATSSLSNRFGWIVQIVGQRSDANGTTVLMVRSLHRDEFPASRRVPSSRRHQRDIFGPKYLTAANCRFEKRHAHDEPRWCRIGQIDRREFRPRQALEKYDSAGSSAKVKQIVASAPDLIRREPRATFDLTDPVQFQEDFRASWVIDSTWPHQVITVQVTDRGGQAHQPSSIDKNKTAQWRQERVLKKAGARRRKPQGTKSIEVPRRELLKHWHSYSEVIANLNYYLNCFYYWKQ